MAVDYKNTVFLPKTAFPMRANLPQREPEILEKWSEIRLYEKMLQMQEGKPKFILHDGPPFANGHLHIGHALNKILKDIVNRSHHFLGFQAVYVPGWDCHGLPIEWKIEEKYKAAGKHKKDVPLTDFRKECREFAAGWVEVQSKEFQRMGVLGDWGRPYLTMDYKAEAQIVREIGKFLLNGSLYKGERPVMWSVVEQTVLAEAEIEYQDHTSSSIYVRFRVMSSPLKDLKGAYAVIWTTTPWTLPGNRAVAYGEDIQYALIEVQETAQDSLSKQGEKLLLARVLVDAVCKAVGIHKYETLKTYQGSALKGASCAHPFRGQGYDFDVPLLPGDHVVTDAGTGLVHTAPGHGVEDFKVGKAFSLEIPKTVAGDGTFYAHIPLFAGEHVYKVNPHIIETLKQTGCLLSEGKVLHSYPHSWRSKAPLIYRTTPQWFISMDTEELRDKALQAVKKVSWIPEASQRRMESMIENRPDWCISRQRAWGVPISLFVSKKTGEPLRDAKVHERIAAAIEKEGSEAWFTRNPIEFLGPDYTLEDYEQTQDIIDVWFESGCTHSFILESRPDLTWPASLYLEGSDQHRGWFQTSLLEACGTRGRAPFEKVLTHGFVLDDKGYKMSKSLGNTVAPENIAKEMGIEILRLWVVGSDYSQDLRIGPDILKHQQDLYRRLRNTLRYLIGALDGFNETERRFDEKEFPELERWVLHRLYEIDREMRQAISAYQLQHFFILLHTFCANDLSAFYLDVRKDVLYCDAPDNSIRRAMRTTCDHVFRCLTVWLAPVLCFTSEEAWLARYQDAKASVHLQNFPEIPSGWKNEALAEKFTGIRSIRKDITGALELARTEGKIGSSLQAHVIVYDPHHRLHQDVSWGDLAITSGLEIICETPPQNAFTAEEVPEIGIIVKAATGEKCGRCWKVLEEVGADRRYPDLCKRCSAVVHAVEPASSLEDPKNV